MDTRTFVAELVSLHDAGKYRYASGVPIACQPQFTRLMNLGALCFSVAQQFEGTRRNIGLGFQVEVAAGPSIGLLWLMGVVSDAGTPAFWHSGRDADCGADSDSNYRQDSKPTQGCQKSPARPANPSGEIKIGYGHENPQTLADQAANA